MEAIPYVYLHQLKSKFVYWLHIYIYIYIYVYIYDIIVDHDRQDNFSTIYKQRLGMNTLLGFQLATPMMAHMRQLRYIMSTMNSLVYIYAVPNPYKWTI